MESYWLDYALRSSYLIIIPIVFALWKFFFPASRYSEFDDMGLVELRKRNYWIDVITFFIQLIAIAIGIAVMIKVKGFAGKNGIILMSCLAIWLPTLFLLAVTLPHGFKRFREYIRWSERRTGRSEKITMIICVPLYSLAIWGSFYLIMQS